MNSTPFAADEPVHVVGGGLAGCECAWQLARRGVRVVLSEMKPVQRSAAHVSDDLAELVCSNSLRGASLANAVGLLKEEMRRLGSLVLEAAEAHAVPAGRALAVDRVAFSRHITRAIAGHPGFVGDDGRTPAHQPVEQRALAHVRGTDDGDEWKAHAPKTTTPESRRTRGYGAKCMFSIELGLRWP